MTQTLVFGALSGALVISGILGPRIGHTIDMVGGRGMLAVSNGVLALGLGLLSVASGPALLFAAWIVIGVGMGMGLYEAAFATLTRIYGMAARKPITGITLIAGFAEHRRLAFDGLARGPLRLARHLPVLGVDPSAAGAAAQSHAAARDVAGSGQRRADRAAHAAREFR